MGRTWLVRGIVAAVVTVLVGAWGVGIAGLGGSDSPTTERPTPSSPETSTAAEEERPGFGENVKPPRTRTVGRSQAPDADPSPDTDEPADDAPGTPVPTSPHPTPDPSTPSEEPSDSPSQPDPSDTPSEPSDECTDLLDILDCLLDPSPGQP